MRQLSGHLFAPAALVAVLLAVGVGLAVGLQREPAGTAYVRKGEPTTAAALKRQPSPPSSAAREPSTPTRPTERPVEIKCRISLASCRKWVALQERNRRLFTRSAQR
jgi:hypothetical protein